MPRSLQVSTANAAYQRIEVLKRNRTKRHRYGEFVVEGVRAINGAVAARWSIRAFAYPRGRQLSRWASSILAMSRAESHLEIDQSLFDTLSEKDDASELLAVVAMQPDTVERLPVRGGMVVVVVDRPASPGNLGTLINLGGQARGLVAGVGTNSVNAINNATQTGADASSNASLVSGQNWAQALQGIGTAAAAAYGSSYGGGSGGGGSFSLPPPYTTPPYAPSYGLNRNFA